MSPNRGSVARTTSISPPPKRRRLLLSSLENHPDQSQHKEKESEDIQERSQDVVPTHTEKKKTASNTPVLRVVPSPVQLNFVEELPAPSNVDTISLGSILGNVMIRECWLFNYLFDLDFVMSQFDPDIKDLAKVHIVHGSWRKEDLNKIAIDDAARRYKNIDVITAFMPEPFGTHHSKMIVLFRHDDLAQVVILTGNFIERDWCMSQAIWQSPLLPSLKTGQTPDNIAIHTPGSGLRFKHDLMAYIKAYGAKLKDLTFQLNAFDFAEVRAALIASTPCKQNLQSSDPETETLWGWPSLKYILSHVPKQTQKNTMDSRADDDPQDLISHVVIQVSSIASLGAKWLTTTLFPALSVLKKSTLGSTVNASRKTETPRFSIVFPTAEAIRKSVNGYGSGASIHMKTQTVAQAKQLSDLRPMLCHWAGNTEDAKLDRAAGRKRAAPHIKTYIRFSDSSMHQIDWAMVTSANLSTQAWGAASSATGEVRICSYEIGVIVWPALWIDADSDDCDVRMVPVFRRDTPEARISKETIMVSETSPDPRQQMLSVSESEHGKEAESPGKETLVAWRMPYDLPLVPYQNDDMPWCASEPCNEPDWLGRIWPGYRK